MNRRRMIMSVGNVDSGEPIDLSMVDNAGRPRLLMTTANCYMVHKKGSYKLPLVYGNAIKNGQVNTSAFYTDIVDANVLKRFVNHNNDGIAGPWLTKSGSGINAGMGLTAASAELIWQDALGLISQVGIDGDYLTFTIRSFTAGNAVIAVKDSSGTVMWSWHIWATSETFENVTSIDTGEHIYYIAPTSVGWVPSGTYYGYAPYYQWGRKDPMISSNGSGNYNHNTWDIDGTQLTSSANNTYYSRITGAHTIGETIQNPISFYENSSTYGPYNETKYNYWDAENTTLDISYSTYRSVSTVKTVYDPCPPDFCIPTSNLFYYIGVNNSSYFRWSATPAGRTWRMGGASVFFYASGYRSRGSGSLGNVGSHGYYWTATPNSTENGSFLFFYRSGAGCMGNYRVNGYNVWAVTE